MSNSEATADIALPRKYALAIASRIGRYPLVVLHVTVDVKRLFELGPLYPWPRPPHCLCCNSVRVWGHGYVTRYFEGFIYPLWVRRLRCPDCSTVYTLRPDLFYRGFRYSLKVILASLTARIEGRRLTSIPRQNQQYWFKGLKFQALRLKNIMRLNVDTLQEIISRGLVPVSHSLNCAILRL